ncbi:hypothetical protein J437_LFUL005121 [Ladona fulva]|uniref:Uncharacterized protein n=1 Tax=Ladona fulva TaxID=123851 RepID=A0A8K0P4Z1_LADFU|nr:hypothetical protein J437_LFUL005121 [Ladona fulva]
MQVYQEANTNAVKKKHKSWMTDEILPLMDERRAYKIKNPMKYIEIHRKIKRKIKEAKEKWLSEQCMEIEELEKKHDSYNMHKRIRDITRMGKRRTTSLLIDTDVYFMGQIPADWLLSTSIAIPKKPNTRDCNEYRTISLMSHTLKDQLLGPQCCAGFKEELE